MRTMISREDKMGRALSRYGREINKNVDHKI
jgi:hypothetical protein